MISQIDVDAFFPSSNKLNAWIEKRQPYSRPSTVTESSPAQAAPRSADLGLARLAIRWLSTTTKTHSFPFDLRK